MALSRIQSYILKKHGLPFGDYQYFSSRIECLFRTPVISILDEYGLPAQVGEKIKHLLGTDHDLDLALYNLKRADFSKVHLDPFEREMLSETQQGVLKDNQYKL